MKFEWSMIFGIQMESPRFYEFFFFFFAFRCVILWKLPRNMRHCIRYLMLILQMTRSKRLEAILAICVEFGKDWTLLELCLNSSCPLSKLSNHFDITFCNEDGRSNVHFLFCQCFSEVHEVMDLFHPFYRKNVLSLPSDLWIIFTLFLPLQKNLYE